MLIPSVPVEVDRFMPYTVEQRVDISTGCTLNFALQTRGSLIRTVLVGGGTEAAVLGPTDV